MSQYKELYCDSRLGGWAGSCVATRPGEATTRPAAKPRHGAGREAERAGRAGRRWGTGAGVLGRRAHGRAGLAGCPGGDTCMQPVTRPALAMTRPGQGPQYGHWARLCTPGCAQLGQFGCFVHLI